MLQNSERLGTSNWYSSFPSFIRMGFDGWSYTLALKNPENLDWLKQPSYGASGFSKHFNLGVGRQHILLKKC